MLFYASVITNIPVLTEKGERMKTFSRKITPKEWDYIEEPMITVEEQEFSEWVCYLFGNTPKVKTGLEWRPAKGCEPNWFWRKMQWLILGNTWKKEIKEKENETQTT